MANLRSLNSNEKIIHDPVYGQQIAIDIDGNTFLHRCVNDCKDYTELSAAINGSAFNETQLKAMAITVNNKGKIPLQLAIFKGVRKILKCIKRYTVIYDAEPPTVKYTIKQLYNQFSQHPNFLAMKKNLEVGCAAFNAVRDTFHSSATHVSINKSKKTRRLVSKQVKIARNIYDEMDDLIDNCKDSEYLDNLNQLNSSYQHHQYGNCSEYAMAALIYLANNLTTPINVEVIATTHKGGDHVFTVLDRNLYSTLNDSKTWGPSAVIVDAHAGRIFPAIEAEKYLTTFLHIKTSPLIKKKINILQNYNPAFHQFEIDYSLATKETFINFFNEEKQSKNCSQTNKHFKNILRRNVKDESDVAWFINQIDPAKGFEFLIQLYNVHAFSSCNYAEIFADIDNHQRQNNFLIFLKSNGSIRNWQDDDTEILLNLLDAEQLHIVFDTYVDFFSFITASFNYPQAIVNKYLQQPYFNKTKIDILNNAEKCIQAFLRLPTHSQQGLLDSFDNDLIANLVMKNLNTEIISSILSLVDIGRISALLAAMDERIIRNFLLNNDNYFNLSCDLSFAKMQIVDQFLEMAPNNEDTNTKPITKDPIHHEDLHNAITQYMMSDKCYKNLQKYSLFADKENQEPNRVFLPPSVRLTRDA